MNLCYILIIYYLNYDLKFIFNLEMNKTNKDIIQIHLVIFFGIVKSIAYILFQDANSIL